MKIQFKKSPTGKYGLGYGANAIADLPEERAKTLIADGYAVALTEEKKSTGEKIKISKTALDLLETNGIDPQTVTPSGKDGSITIADAEAAVAAKNANPVIVDPNGKNDNQGVESNPQQPLIS